MQFTINSFRQLFPHKIFFPDISLIFSKIPDISLTAAKFPDISMFSRQVVPLQRVQTSAKAVTVLCATRWHPLVSRCTSYIMIHEYTDRMICHAVSGYVEESGKVILAPHQDSDQ